MLSVPSMNNPGSAGPLGSGNLSQRAVGPAGGMATFDYQGFGDTSKRAFSIASGGHGRLPVWTIRA